LVEAVLRSAERRQVAVYLVGGPVRDLLLERAIRDVDLVVVPQAGVDAEVIARDAAPRGARVTTHDRFATVTLESGEATIDLATARRESYARPGALPRIEPGSLQDDLARRDFSVNALALPLSGPDVLKGKSVVVGPESGLADLAAGTLRVLHPASFHDDPTRALRAARLAARLGFSLARGSGGRLRDAIRDGAFGAVSGDRLRREIEHVFADATLGLNPADALRRLEEWHVLAALEPGLGFPRKAVAPLRRLGRFVAAPAWKGPRLRPWIAGLCVWLAEVSPALRRRSARRFGIRGEVSDRITGFAKARDGWLRALTRARGRGAVDAVLDGIDEERLLGLYVSAPPAIRRRVERWAVEDRSRRSPVGGADLEAIGISGPAVGRALGRIRAAYLDGALANREEALALAGELARGRGRPPGARTRSPRRPRATS
jgi:tRNA nucleotidyltransferase (CCA-adding enzyme)